MQALDLHNNQLSGAFIDTTFWLTLRQLHANDNMLSSVGGISVSVEKIDFSSNRLMEYPTSLRKLPAATQVLLQDNLISHWPRSGVLPRDAFVGENYYCGHSAKVPRFEWPKLRQLNAFNNPIGQGIEARGFLASVAYLPDPWRLAAERPAVTRQP